MNKNKFYQIENEIDKIIFSTEKNISESYKEASAAIKHEIAELNEKHGQLDLETMSKYNRLDALDKKIELVTKEVFNSNRVAINAGLRSSFVDASKGLIDIARKNTTGRTLQPIVKSKKVTEVINSKVKNLSWRDRMGKHQGDAIYELKKQVGEGIANGETYGELAKRIQKTYDVSENKAKSIARNETARVKSASEKETMDEVAGSGVKMTKTWNNVLDERSRKNHADMDGVTIPYDEDFNISGKEGPAPRLINDYNGEENISCRCFLTYEFADKE